jgi:hypothetical protein
MSLKVVFLYHQKLFHRLRAYFKLQGRADCFQFKELRAELILNKPHRLDSFLANLILWLSNLEEDLIILGVSDLEVDKLYAVDIVFRLAEKIWCGCL